MDAAGERRTWSEEDGTPSATLILGDGDVQRLLDPVRCLELQSLALQYHARTARAGPPRGAVDVPGAALRLATMLGFAPEEGAVAVKVLTNAPGNRGLGVPRNLSTLVLLEHRTGYPLAVIGSTYLTSARTAATAVLALRTLADPEARDVGLYGTGPIAALIVESLAAVGGGGWSVVAHSPTQAHRERFCERFAAEDRVRVRCTADRREPASQTIVVAATDGRAQAFESAWLAPSGTVVSVASRAAVAEVPAGAFVGAFAVVDDARGAVAEAAEFRDGRVPIHAQLGEVLAGTRNGRAEASERWIFKSTGMAVQDAWTAREVYLRARRSGTGHEVRLVGTALHGSAW